MRNNQDNEVLGFETFVSKNFIPEWRYSYLLFQHVFINL